MHLLPHRDEAGWALGVWNFGAYRLLRLLSCGEQELTSEKAVHTSSLALGLEGCCGHSCGDHSWLRLLHAQAATHLATKSWDHPLILPWF